jgi:hypothetical protein
MTIVHSFHTGAPLNLWEQCCLRSFADHGHEVVLFSYDQLEVPRGIELSAAKHIISESRRDSFFAIAPGQYGQFSDLFRYELLHARGGWWIDTDMLCLSSVLPNEEVVIGQKKPIRRREPFRINGAAMRFPAGHALLKEASTVLNADLDLIGSSWRSIAGPDLLTKLVPQYGIEPREISLFYPIGGRASWNFCDPEKRDEVAIAVSDSPMIHLWQERFRAAGLPRDKLPPVGSFLADAFTRHGGSASSLTREELRMFAPRKTKAKAARNSRPRSVLRSVISRIVGGSRA